MTTPYRELVERFFIRYETPVIEELIVGFSGIDPPLKVDVLSTNVNHEELSNLLGGDDDGHYHLTKEQYDELRKLIDNPPEPTPPPEPEPEPMTDYDGGYASTTEAEYEENADYWLDGGGAADTQEDDVDGGASTW